MPFARRIAAGYFGRGVASDDIEQVAYLALVKAMRRFDRSRGNDFKAFAGVTIRGDIRRYFRDSAWLIRPPRTVQELQARVWAARDDLDVSLHRSPTMAELSEETGLGVEQVSEALALHGCFTVDSYDAPDRTRDAVSMTERIGLVEPGFERADAVVVLRDAVRDLSSRDRQIIGLRFFDGLTQKEIGERIGVTQMQVSRLLTRILDDLRSMIGETEAVA